MFIKTKGIVLRETSYQEQDKLLTILTQDHGKVTVKAKGAKSTRNTMKAAYQIMAFSELTLMEQHGHYIVTEAVTKELFSELQGDIELLSLASYFLQVTETVAQEEDPEPELLSLLLNVLYALGKLKKPQSLVKTVFELRLCSIIGFLPALEGCGYCGEGQPAFFHIKDGQLSCASCAESVNDGIRMPLSPGAVDALRYICYGDAKKIVSFQLSQEGLQQLANLSEAYLCTQLERGFYTLDFYKTLLYGVKL